MTTKPTQLQTSPFPKMVKEFAEENFNLKVLASLLLGINLIALVLVLYLVKQGPKVIALQSTGEVSSLESKITNLQIEAAVKEYLRYRYSWNAGSIAESLSKAKFFVLPQLVPAFERSMAEVQKFVREKKVTQRVYPKTVTVDLKEKKIVILADRFTEFDQLKAATEMKLSLGFTVENRTVTNPWGVYITKETEEVSR